MTQRVRSILRITTATIAGLLLVVVLAGIVIVQTKWFSDTVRSKIVGAVETATGGTVEIGSFSFDWKHLRARIEDFTIRGLEPKDSAPLFHAAAIQADLKLLSPFHGFVDIAYLLLDQPQARVIVFPDGHTNIPAPKVPAKHSDKTGLETIVDLAIGHFDLRNGSFTFGNQQTALSASGANFRAQLGYNALDPSYTGQIAISPLQVRTGGNAPVDIDIQVPVSAHKDRLEIANAQFRTGQSHIVVSGSMEHLVDPRTSAHVNAEVMLDDVRRAAGLSMPLDLTHGPKAMKADITATMDQNAIRIQSARLGLGRTTIEASGDLKEAKGGAGATFNATLDLGELGTLFKVAARPEGVVKLGGKASLDAQNNYSAAGNIEAKALAFRNGDTRISNVNFDSSVSADSHRIALSNLRLGALGGRFTGSAMLEEMSAFQVKGTLSDFHLASIGREFLNRRLGYNGVISGPVEATGDLKRTNDLAAKVNLAISPTRGGQGIPVAGRLNAGYNGRADIVTLNASYIALPNSRVDLGGELGKQIDVKLVSHNFADFQPVAEIPIAFSPGGSASADTKITGTLTNPRITGALAMSRFSVQGRPFTNFAADVAASPSGVQVTNAVIARGALQMQLTASAGLRQWKALPENPLRVDATIRNADTTDVLALAGQTSISATGAFTMDARIGGTIGSPTGNVDVAALNGAIEGQKYDAFQMHAQMTPNAIVVPTLSLTSGAARLDASAEFQHAANDLSQGSLRAHVTANQVQLAQFQALVKDRPGLAGAVTLNGDGTGTLKAGEFAISSLNANVALRGLAMEGKALGDLTATANAAGSLVHYNVSSNLAGSSIRVNGQSDLNGDHATTASADISNLPIDRVLALAGQRNLPVKGSLTVTAQVSGTLQDPHANANFTVVNGAAWQEPFNKLEASVNYTARSVDVPRLHLEDGPSTIDGTLAFAHPANDFEDGDVQLHLNSNRVQLARLHTLQQAKPGLAGSIELTADAVGRLRKNAAPLFSTLNANLRASGITLNQQNLGDLTLTAATRGGAVNFNLVSDIAHSDIKGSGSVELTANYPVRAQVTFAKVTYRGLSPLISQSDPLPIDGSVEGSVNLSGSASDTNSLSGTLQVTKLEAHSAAPAGVGSQPRVALDLSNSGNIVAALNRGVVTVQNFKLAGRDANLAVSGTASIAGGPLALRTTGNVNLEILEALSSDIYSSGAITLDASVAGTAASPNITGQLQLQNASFNMLDLPNGLSNATGVISFNGTEAYIRNITGESGGGKVVLAGDVVYGGPQLQFRVQATANDVHVQYPDTITTVVNANVAVSGTSTSSLVTGTVTINGVSMHSGADVGNILTQAAAPPTASSGSGGPLAGMRFDVHIVTAPDTQFRSTLTKNVQATANLTLLGTPDNPGMLGRLSVSEGDVVFFGSKYTINEGSITFSDASKINPILNVDLETTVQGIDVSLTVAGPMNQMKLSYRSDPPMQFQQIVSLLASGTPPSTDPVLAAHTNAAPQQNLEQSGASTLLGQAVANPVSGRLQRLFGVSHLSIDPQIIGATNTAQATLTLQQQITPAITFTYIEDVSSSNPQLIRAEWAINRRYSAIAQRDVNGSVTVDLFYKKRFH